MARTIVTAGVDYLDVDAYGGILAYAELLKKQGFDAVACSTAAINVSVPLSLQAFCNDLDRDYVFSVDDKFVVIDLSDPKHFDSFVEQAKVIGVIDHHVGFESFWQERIGSNTHIEFVGAACTLVYEQWAKAGLVDSMSVASATLLAAGIIDNTLNFKAKLTTERDRKAFAALAGLANLQDNWAQNYLKECQTNMLTDFRDALSKDTKVIQYPRLNYEMAVGQVAVLDAEMLLASKKHSITDYLGSRSNHWYMNILDLESGRSLFYTSNQVTKQWLANLLKVNFNGDRATADRLWLRKEIYKEANHEKNSSK